MSELWPDNGIRIRFFRNKSVKKDIFDMQMLTQNCVKSVNLTHFYEKVKSKSSIETNSNTSK